MTKDIRDIVGGLAMTAVGLFAAYHAGTRYALGEAHNMGPGYFPVVLGVALSILGLLVAIPACFRSGRPVHVEWKTLALVVGSLVLFAMLLRPLGLILSTAVTVIVASLADNEIRWRSRLLLVAGIAAITYLIFSLALGMVLPLWPWSR